MDVSDDTLARAAADGDGKAFALLLERHYDRIFRLAFRFMGRREDAEDLTQDICAALPAKLAQYRGEARVTSWLYRVVFNAAQDLRRRRATQTKAAEDWGAHEPDRRAAQSEAAEAQGWLMQAMRHLPEDLRDTLVLIFDDLTHAEAAEVLGVSEGTVSWRMSEARKALRALKEAEE